MLTAFNSPVWIINRQYSGTPTAANYMEQPTLTAASGAYQSLITSPSEKDVAIEPGYYLDDYRQFHFASGAIANQGDYIQIAGTNDNYWVTGTHSWYVVGTICKERILGRRIKTV